MKKQFYIIVLAVCFLASCNKSNTEKAEDSIIEYLESNLKKSDSYESIKFLSLDTLNNFDKSDKVKYSITHLYSIENAENEKIKMNIVFYLDKNLKVIKTNTKSINGDYGSFTGNVYWKYNEYVGNKADSGAEITLYSLDSLRGISKYETTADFQGNYKFNKVLTGKYFLIIRSKNTTDCPDRHVQKIELYREDLNKIFKIDFSKYNNEFTEILRLDSLYTTELFNSSKHYDNISAHIKKYTKIENEKLKKSEDLINKFPENFKSQIKLFTPYSNAFDFGIIRIEENNTVSENTDFGITCI